MLKLIIPSIELYDESKEVFIQTKERALTLEHSLVSLSKWESKWNKPFLTKEEKTSEETIDYVRCMTITQNVDSNVYKYLTVENLAQVRNYIEAPMTATKISNEHRTINREIITSEIIYYWMIALHIPFECRKWHLNKLLMLINVCNLKNAPPKKMSRKSVMSKNAALNAARRKAMHSKG